MMQFTAFFWQAGLQDNTLPPACRGNPPGPLIDRVAVGGAALTGSL